MNAAFEQLLQPRLVLAVIVVIAATAGLLMDQLAGSEWGITVGAGYGLSAPAAQALKNYIRETRL